MGKEEAVLQFDQSVVDAKGALFDAGHSEGKALGDAEGHARGFAEGVASVPASPEVQVLIDAAVAAKALEDQVKIDAIQAELDLVKSDDEADKAQIAAKQEIIDRIKALLG